MLIAPDMEMPGPRSRVLYLEALRELGNRVLRDGIRAFDARVRGPFA